MSLFNNTTQTYVIVQIVCRVIVSELTFKHLHRQLHCQLNRSSLTDSDINMVTFTTLVLYV